jgi:FkbM family methyltransferase
MTFISYAQNFEDIMLWRALKHVGKGFYIDVGANDPVIDSVTLAFYERGWHGINVEPMRQYYDRLRIHRPADINLQVAVGDAESELTLFDVQNTGLSTLDAAIGAQHVQAGHKVVQQKVKVRTLSDICAEHVQGAIHFIKIDVEGFEKPALQGMDLRRWRPWILVIEATKPQSQASNHEEWEDLVLGANYRLAYFDGLNRYYVAEEQQGLMSAFDAPPNFFDHFQLRRGHAFSYPIHELETRLERARAKIEASTQQSQMQLRELEDHLLDAQMQLQQSKQQTQLAQLQAQQVTSELQRERELVAAIYSTLSWRITAPLRKIMTVARRPGASAKKMLRLALSVPKKIIVRIAKRAYANVPLRILAARTLKPFPRLEARLKRAGKAIVDRDASKPTDAHLQQATDALSPDARKVFADLKRTLSRNQ